VQLTSSSEVEYHRYLKEVVQALEKDPEFRAKLEKVPEEDIRVSLILKIIKILELLSNAIYDLIKRFYRRAR